MHVRGDASYLAACNALIALHCTALLAMDPSLTAVTSYGRRQPIVDAIPPFSSLPFSSKDSKAEGVLSREHAVEGSTNQKQLSFGSVG